MLTYRGVTALEFAFVRSCFNMLASALLIRKFNEQYFSSIPRNLVRVVVLRAITGTIGFLCFTAAPKYLPLGIFFVVFNSNIFTTALLAFCWLSERISAVEVALMFCAFGGILVLGLSESKSQDAVVEENVEGEDDPSTLWRFGLFVAMITTLGQSVIAVSTRKLKDINFAVIQFNYALLSSGVMGVAIIVIYITTNKVPFIYGTWWTYLEILFASSLNMIA